MAWSDGYYQRTRKWLNRKYGDVVDEPGTTWLGVDRALKAGNRGLPGGSSLARLLHKCRMHEPGVGLLWLEGLFRVDHNARKARADGRLSAPAVFTPASNSAT